MAFACFVGRCVRSDDSEVTWDNGCDKANCDFVQKQLAVDVERA